MTWFIDASNEDAPRFVIAPSLLLLDLTRRDAVYIVGALRGYLETQVHWPHSAWCIRDEVRWRFRMGEVREVFEDGNVVEDSEN